MQLRDLSTLTQLKYYIRLDKNAFKTFISNWPYIGTQSTSSLEAKQSSKSYG